MFFSPRNRFRNKQPIINKDRSLTTTIPETIQRFSSSKENNANSNAYHDPLRFLSKTYATLLHEIAPGHELEFPLLSKHDSKLYEDVFGHVVPTPVRNFRGVCPTPTTTAVLVPSHSQNSHDKSTIRFNTDRNSSSFFSEVKEDERKERNESKVNEGKIEEFTELVASDESQKAPEIVEEGKGKESQENVDRNRIDDTATVDPNAMTPNEIAAAHDKEVDRSNQSENEPAVIEIESDQIQRVVDLIRRIGDIIAQGEVQDSQKNHSTVFEYFCDKNILSLFVDIVKAKPHASTQSLAPVIIDPISESDESVPSTSTSSSTMTATFSPIVWVPQVKAQVLQTLSILITTASLIFEDHPDCLYFLLSNHFLNDLILSFIPLQQWSESELQVMIPAYTSFLKTITIQLGSNPQMYLLFTHSLPVPSSTSITMNSDTPATITSTTTTYFPIFVSAVEILTSSYHCIIDTSNIRPTVLSIILQICQLSAKQSQTAIDPDREERNKKMEIGSILEASLNEQYTLIQYLGNEFKVRYSKLCSLLDEVSDDDTLLQLPKEFSLLQDHLHFVNDLLLCDIANLNQRICEYFLESVVFGVLLPNLLTQSSLSSQMSSSLDNAVVSTEVADKEKSSNTVLTIAGTENIKAHFTIYVFAHIFNHIKYEPLVKMIAITLLHPYSPLFNHSSDTRLDEACTVTTVLHSIVKDGFSPFVETSIQNDPTTANKRNDPDRFRPNPYRKEIVKLLRGDMGDYRFVPAAILVESVLKFYADDTDVLVQLQVLPGLTDGSNMETHNKNGSSVSPFEDALGLYFMNSRRRTSTSLSTSLAATCAVSVAFCFMDLLMLRLAGHSTEHMSLRFRNSSIIRGAFLSRRQYAIEAQRLEKSASVGSLLFAELVEKEVSRLYKMDNLKMSYANVSMVSLLSDLQVLIPKSCETNKMDLDSASFAIRMVLQMRFLCRSFRDMYYNLVNSIESGTPQCSDGITSPTQISGTVDAEIMELAGMHKQPKVGTEMDIRGKTLFYFQTSTRDLIASPGRRNERIFLIESDNVFVLKPNFINGSNRATIVFVASLRNILAAAPDDESLHIAFQLNEKDDTFLTSNGIMELQFDSIETCSAVKRWLEVNQSSLKEEHKRLITNLLECCVQESFDNTLGIPGAGK